MSSAEQPVSVSGLRMRYGASEVLRGVDLDVGRGETLALLGPNGAGKTTLVEILEGHRRRTGGDAAVLGRDPERVDDRWRARIGVVLQEAGDHGTASVRQLLR
jgi:ABC-2 type transport system ATP-binding protein